MANFWRKAAAEVFPGAGGKEPARVAVPRGPTMAIDGSTLYCTFRARKGSELLLRFELRPGRDGCDDVVWVYDDA